MLNDDLKAIETLIPIARQLTRGSFDPLFDVILDGEAVLNGGMTLAAGSREDVAAWVRAELQRDIERRHQT